MRTRLLATIGYLAALAATLTACAAPLMRTHTLAHSDAPTAISDGLLMPACDNDLPDPAMSAPCVWPDETEVWVLTGDTQADYPWPLCATEDSPWCVWRVSTDVFLVNRDVR